MFDDDLQTMGLATVGAQYRGSRGPQILSRLAAARAPSWLGNATEQGVSTPAEELDVLPFTLSGNLTNAAPSQNLTAFPQRPFRGERLVMTAVYNNGAGSFTDGSGLVAISPAIYVGAVQVGASQGQISVGAFAATAFGVRLSLPTAGQGTRVYIPLELTSSIANQGTVNVVATLFGRAVR